MSNRWVEINYSLKLCRKVFAILKQKNPDLIPDNIDIVAYRKNSKKCHFYDGMKKGYEDTEGWIAHFDQHFLMPPHVCLKQDFLFFPLTIPTCEDDPDNVPKKRMQLIEGNWAIIEIMCHELTHSIIIGHDKDFFKLYYKYLSQMAQMVISGEFYNWYSRQHQSTKRLPPTREWLDYYLAWK